MSWSDRLVKALKKLSPEQLNQVLRQAGVATNNIPQAPFSAEAEEATLGAVLINPAAYFSVAMFLKAEHFFLVRNQWIFEAMSRAATKNDTAWDYLIVARELQEAGHLEEVGGAGHLLNLVNHTPSSVHVEAYARLVQRTYARRQVLSCAQEMITDAIDETIAIDEGLGKAESRLNEIDANLHDRDTVLSGRDSIEAYDEILANRAQRTAAGEHVVYPLPIPWINIRSRVTEAFAPGQLVIISGGPGSGKSAGMETLCEHYARMKIKSEYIHTEMRTQDMLDRRMARHARIPYDRLIEGNLTEPEQARKMEAETHIAEWVDHINYSHMPDVAFSKLKAHLWRQYMRGAQIIFIDHFQDINIPVPKGINEIKAYEGAVTWLAAFAEKRNVLLFLGSQVNDKGATMWTKKLEQKASFRISIERTQLSISGNSYYLGNTEYRAHVGQTNPKAIWNFRKARYGAKGKVEMINHGPGFAWLDPSEVSSYPVDDEPIPFDPSVLKRMK